MIVRLQNLSARAPVMTDVQAVINLLRVCDATDSYESPVTEEDIQSTWQAQNFTLRRDAWVIVTNKGQIVAYADVRQGENGCISTSLHVHPGYSGRGVGTLLIWLAEERARQIAREVYSNARSSLRITANSVNACARHLLEREGYTKVHSFWRVMIDMDNISSSSRSEFYQHDKLRANVAVDDQSTGLYVAREYDVYEKELQTGSPIIEEACEDMCTV